MKLQTDTTDQLFYGNEILQLTVLGGIKLEGLDRMRVTIKIQEQQSSRPPVRHNLDLYNDTQLEKFIRKVAEKLEIGTNVIAASLSELTEELEKYRLDKIKEKEENLKPKIRQLTKVEKEEAVTFLKSKNLLQKTNILLGEAGLIGEETNRLLMYLIFTTRKLEKPLHIISLGSSGTGKTYLQEKVSQCIPPEEVINITTLSDNAFYYFGKTDLKYKLIVIEDLDGAANALYPLRELQTKNRIVKTIVQKNTKGETKTIYLVVEGPVSVAGCTTWEHIYEDNANRCFLIYLDESDQQDQKIMQYQRLKAAGKIDGYKQRETQEFLQNTQRMLQPIKIINPYAEQLILPQTVFKPRRTNEHYLQFIEAVTFYYQHQRKHRTDKTTGEIYINTTLEDIENANMLLKEILLRKSDELTGACRNYLENLKEYLKIKKKKTFTSLEIRTQLRIKESTLRNYQNQLQILGYIRRKKDVKTKSYTFELMISRDYETLQKGIDTALDQAFKQLTTKEQ
ncbi:hypothetical protein OQJ66_19795 [Aquimarina muelleri]|uniref:hypothetical protein n=2 Tax=Aquimarina muelleri TaxID=279356 RepID=UPI00224986E8|nr:hypothetical protein [Aquimarina muelleri]MCX2765042.1 hypothetical protein [Aquimarina muelleri]